MEKKFWLDSLTVRSGLLAVIPTVYQLCKLAGLEIPDGVLESIAEGIAGLLTLISLIGVFIGSFKKDRAPLGFSPPKK